MRICLAVPTFWTFPGGSGEEDVIYDHPTPLDADGTLNRCLDSLKRFAAVNTAIVVVAAAAADSLQTAVEQRVRDLLKDLPPSQAPLLFSYTHLKKLHSFCKQQGRTEFLDLLSLTGYAAVRNLTLVAANLVNADIMVSLDDDEIIADVNYVTRILDDFFILSKDYDMFGLAGLYQNPNGNILAPEPAGAWVQYWPKIRWMNEIFAKLAEDDAVLKLTPLALGGNMAVGSSLYRFLPFDPAVTRGEDIDYVINARMFQVPFFLDPQLRIVHDPPAKPHPLWRRLRQDLQRFWYTRLKLLAQENTLTPAKVTASELMPYPGKFLTADLELRAYRAHLALAREYLSLNQTAEAEQTLLNLSVFQNLPPADNVLKAYVARVEQWRRLQSWLNQPEVRKAAVEILWH
jgi:hypothetical protein